MPQVKELKGLDAAGSAADTTKTHEFFVQWHLTERCNLRCRHCYQAGVRCAEMGADEILHTAQVLRDLFRDWAETYDIRFSPSLTVTGGEPLIRNDLFALLEAGRRLGFELHLLTNGTLVTARIAGKLRDIGVQTVQVSIDGTEEAHDALRGGRAFRRAMQGVEALVAASLEVTLNVTLCRLNFRSVEALSSLARESGARLGFSRLVPSGRGAALLPEMLTAGEVRETYERLLSLEEAGAAIVTGDPLASQMRTSSAPQDGASVSFLSAGHGGCAAGVSGFTLLSDGTITPCRRLPHPLGNVRGDSLREVWAASPVLNALRDRKGYTGRCGKCSRWSECRGCRAIAYAYGLSQGREDFLSDDPQCFIKA